MENSAKPAKITVPAILIKIEREWHPALTAEQLYERTRRYWRCNPERQSTPPRYALSVARGLIREVFDIDHWEDYPDMSREVPDPTRRHQQWSEADRRGQARKGFIGAVTQDESLRRALIGKSVRHVPFGSGNPIAYVGCDRQTLDALRPRGEQTEDAERQLLTPIYARSEGYRFRLDCGREVFLEECYISLSDLGWLEGREDKKSAYVIKRLPIRVRRHFPDSYGLLIKPVPEGDLPIFTFMVELVCYQPLKPEHDCSGLVVCWLGNEIEMSLSELIAREIRSIEWDKYALDFDI